MLILSQLITNFDLNNISGADKISLDFDGAINVYINFKYEDFSSKKFLHISLMFIGCQSKPNDWPSLIDFLDVTRLSISDISHFGWEGLHWVIEDYNDDGLSLFKIFCDEIKVMSISDHKTLIYKAEPDDKVTL